MKYLSYILLIFVLISCKKEESEIEFGYDYFGLKEGRYVIYDGLYIRHDVNLVPAHDTTFYKLKTVVGKDYIDNQGRTAKEFYRYLWNEDADAWEVKDLYTAIINEGKAELVEENRRKIKMVFAISSEKEWDVNAFNTQDEDLYNYQSIFVPRSYGANSFSSTVTVNQEVFESLVDHKRQFEVYADGVGMVKKYYKNLRIQFSDSTNIVSGIEEFLTVTSFGFE